MAVYSLEKLIQGDENIVEYYNNARNLWTEIKSSDSFRSVAQLAQTLTDRQLQFEHQCGGRWIGQEIMVIVGIGQFYTTEVGFEATLEDAVKVRDAFAQSYCSIEVKFHAEKTSQIFGLTDENE